VLKKSTPTRSTGVQYDAAMDNERFDFVVVGSGFGGSVSALRLVEKGWRVLLVEKGRRFGGDDFPTTNWDVRRWLWSPKIGLRGFFQMSFLEHLTVLHGVGYGGGSLVYANTLPTPKDEFFAAPSWASLADWRAELAPHYAEARRMLGVATNPRETRGDRVLKQIADETGRGDGYALTDVGVFFGAPGERVKDPYFGGEGPDRSGCTFCGACMTGCRHGAKNSLDKNYLWLAEKRGLVVRAETEVVAVRDRGGDGFLVELQGSLDGGKARGAVAADRVVLAGGVMGTVPLLLRMREEQRGLPRLSARVGDFVRTNSEALIGIVSPSVDEDFTDGVAITSILHTDDHSHVEPVRYGRGSGFFRALALPHSPAATTAARLVGAMRGLAAEPTKWWRALTVDDHAKQTQILLYMRTLEGTLQLRLGRGARTGFSRGLQTQLPADAEAPRAFLDEATELARRFAEKVDGVPMSILTETLLGVPTTAHVLGGACMAASPDDGVIDARHRVHGYDGLFVVDGSAISANPGVNPSLTITALAERAMSLIPARA
jgi:cholesterol oxidase